MDIEGGTYSTYTQTTAIDSLTSDTTPSTKLDSRKPVKWRRDKNTEPVPYFGSVDVVETLPAHLFNHTWISTGDDDQRSKLAPVYVAYASPLPGVCGGGMETKTICSNTHRVQCPLRCRVVVLLDMHIHVMMVLTTGYAVDPFLLRAGGGRRTNPHVLSSALSNHLNTP